jgi:hypothetical protein
VLYLTLDLIDYEFDRITLNPAVKSSDTFLYDNAKQINTRYTRNNNMKNIVQERIAYWDKQRNYKTI